MKRVLALLGACLLVAGAVVARGALDDDDEDGGGSDGDGDGELVVACIPELRDACEAIERDMELRIEDPAETIAAAAAGEEIDAWVTLDPWPEIAAFDLGDNRFLERSPEPVAASELTLVTRRDVGDACDRPPDWVCVTELVPGRAAIATPDRALGRLVLGWATFEWSQVTRPDEPFARAELALPELQAFVESLDLSRRDPLRDALQFGRSGPQAVGTTRADATTIVGTRDEGLLLPTSGAFPASVAVVVVGSDADRIAGEPSFTGALEDLGWELDSSAATTGLPSAGVLYALSQEVSS